MVKKKRFGKKKISKRSVKKRKKPDKILIVIILLMIFVIFLSILLIYYLSKEASSGVDSGYGLPTQGIIGGQNQTGNQTLGNSSEFPQDILPKFSDRTIILSLTFFIVSSLILIFVLIFISARKSHQEEFNGDVGDEKMGTEGI